MEIRRAVPEEAGLISELAIRSKAYWGYDETFMNKARAELAVSRQAIVEHDIFVAEENGRILGYYELKGKPPIVKLNSLFIEPEVIGTGVGQTLFKHAVQLAQSQGYQRMTFDSDPFAEGFYEKMGASQVGEAPSGSIPGRVLPLMEMEL